MMHPENRAPRWLGGEGGYSPVIAVASVGLLFLAALALTPYLPYIRFLTAHFLLRQDVFLLAAAFVVSCAAYFTSTSRTTPLALGARGVAALAVVLALAGTAGHWLILHAYDMSRDEQMARFDALVYASVRLAEPLEGMWRQHADVLNTKFMYPAAPDRAAWISSYLPVNSAIRALASTVANPAIVNPALSAIGLVALWRCVQRIWPGDREALALAAVLYCASGQVLVTSMTSYAMTGHLALNLVWLALLLRNDRWSDAGVIVVGFLATGLHQPLPHPLFAAPLLLWAVHKDWRRGLHFILGYAAICAFWLWWPGYMWGIVQASPEVPRPPGVGFLSRLMTVLTERDPDGFSLTAANLLRFFAWQHVLLLPLLVPAISVVRKQGLPAALAAGVFLTVYAPFLILPYQGHGFGYRYLHGLIGSMILLAVFGWKKLGPALPAWRSMFRSTTLGTVLLLLPLQAWFAQSFYRSYAEVRSQLLAMDADYVVVGGRDVPFAIDLVYNSPRLDERPVFLVRDLITPAFVARFCADHPTVIVADPQLLLPVAAYYGLTIDEKAKDASQGVRRSLAEAGCRVADSG